MSSPVLACNYGDQPTTISYWGVNGTQLARAMARGDTVAYVYDVTGYAAADVVFINAPELRMERLTVASVDAAARTITFTTGCLHAHSIDQDVREAKSPTTVVFTLTNPNGAIVTKAIGDFAVVAVGHLTYSATVMDVRGTWTGEITGTAAVVAGSGVFGFEVA